MKTQKTEQKRPAGRPYSTGTINRTTGLIRHLDKLYAGKNFTTQDLIKTYGVAFRGKNSTVDASNQSSVVCQLNRMINRFGLDVTDRVPTGKRGNRLLSYSWSPESKQRAIRYLTEEMGVQWAEPKAKVQKDPEKAAA